MRLVLLAGACESFESGKQITAEQSSGIDWKIVGNATIVINALQTVETDSLPVREYRFSDFAYDHPADRICTSDRLFCYTLVANYRRTK